MTATSMPSIDPPPTMPGKKLDKPLDSDSPKILNEEIKAAPPVSILEPPSVAAPAVVPEQPKPPAPKPQAPLPPPPPPPAAMPPLPPIDIPEEEAKSVESVMTVSPSKGKSNFGVFLTMLVIVVLLIWAGVAYIYVTNKQLESEFANGNVTTTS